VLTKELTYRQKTPELSELILREIRRQNNNFPIYTIAELRQFTNKPRQNLRPLLETHNTLDYLHPLAKLNAHRLLRHIIQLLYSIELNILLFKQVLYC
jgi:hypothetical protein